MAVLEHLVYFGSDIISIAFTCLIQVFTDHRLSNRRTGCAGLYINLTAVVITLGRSSQILVVCNFLFPYDDRIFRIDSCFPVCINRSISIQLAVEIKQRAAGCCRKPAKESIARAGRS